jgi:hypothetical protein
MEPGSFVPTFLMQGGLVGCQKAWCGPCYTGEHPVEFPIMKPTDEDGYVTLKAKDKLRF